MFAPSDAIELYLNQVITRYGIGEHIQFDTSVISANWDPTAARWLVKTDKGFFSARFLVSCTGQLNVPKLPLFVIKYLASSSSSHTSSAKPVIMHSANYDRGVSLSQKTVAIIGNGSTGVQLVESIAPVAGHLLLFQRSPKWVLPKPFLRVPKLILTPLQLIPFNLGNRLLRLVCFFTIEAMHFIVKKPSFLQRMFAKILTNRITASNPDAAAMNCIPTYAPGCSRIIVHGGYPSTLTRPNVTVVNGAVEGLTEGGEIVTSEGTYSAEVIICATGFEVTDCGPQFDVINGASESLKGAWESSFDRWGGSTLFGVATPAFPNFFVVYGPHTNTILGSITFFSECAASYISQCISRVLKSGKKSVAVREERVIEYNGWIKRAFVGRPELDRCSAWYKGVGAGVVPTANFPGSMSEYAWLLRKWKCEDYIVE